MIDKPPENITYFYSEFQNTFEEIQTLVPQIKFVQGLPDNILDTINITQRTITTKSASHSLSIPATTTLFRLKRYLTGLCKVYVSCFCSHERILFLDIWYLASFFYSAIYGIDAAKTCWALWIVIQFA